MNRHYLLHLLQTEHSYIENIHFSTKNDREKENKLIYSEIYATCSICFITELSKPEKDFCVNLPDDNFVFSSHI